MPNYYEPERARFAIVNLVTNEVIDEADTWPEAMALCDDYAEAWDVSEDEITVRERG